MKTLPALLLLVLLLAGAAPRAAAATGSPFYTDMVIAVVNEEVITLYDVVSFTHLAEDRLSARYNLDAAELQQDDPARRERYQQELKKLRENAAERMIDIEVLYAEFVRQGYQVPAEMSAKRLDQLVAERCGGNYQKFEEELAEAHITMAKIKEQVTKSVAVEMLEHDEIDRRIVVTPAQILAYFTAHPAEFAAPARVRLSLVELSLEGTTPAALAALQDTILKAAQGGTPFAELAKKYSTNSSKNKGGDLGWLEEAKLNKSFREATTGLSKGQLSAWVTIPGGKSSFLLQLTDTSQPTSPALDEATNKKIRSQLFDVERVRRHDQLVERLRHQAYIRLLYKEEK